VVALLVLLALVLASSFRDEAAPASRDARSGETTAGSDRLRGPDVPPRGVLPGRLWVVVPARGPAGSCLMRAVDLGALELEPPGELWHCTLIDVSSDGRYAVAADDELQLGLLDLRERPQTLRELEPSFRDRSTRSSRVAAVFRDGAEVAWCTAANRTAVASVETGDTQWTVGCDPRFGPDGALFTRSLTPMADAVMVGGEVVLAGPQVCAGLEFEDDEPSSLLAYDIGADGVIATEVRRVFGAPQVTVQLWSDGRASSFHRVTGLDPSLERSSPDLSPGGTRIAFGWPGLLAGVLDLGLGQMRRTFDHGAYAWSPDGRWIAIGEGASVAVYARGSDAPTYELPLTTLMLAWTN
jgi:hypothetical protein